MDILKQCLDERRIKAMDIAKHVGKSRASVVKAFTRSSFNSYDIYAGSVELIEEFDKAQIERAAKFQRIKAKLQGGYDFRQLRDYTDNEGGGEKTESVA